MKTSLLLVAATLSLQVACSGPLPDGHERFAIADTMSLQVTRLAERSLYPQVVQTWSLDADVLDIGRLDALAADDQKLVGLDFAECAVVVVPRSGTAQASRFGRCGGGPDEFRGMVGVAVVESALVVVDQQGGRLRTFTVDGRVSGVLKLEALKSSREDVWEVHPLTADALLMVMDFTPDMPLRKRTSQHASPYLRVVDLHTGELRDSALLPGSGVADQVDNSATYVSACVVADRESGKLTLRIANLQYPEIVHLSWNTGNGRFEPPGKREVIPELLLSRWQNEETVPPMPDLTRTACGESGTLMMQASITRAEGAPSSNGGAKWKTTVRPVLQRDGRMTLGPWESNGAWSQLGRLFGSQEDHFIFVNNEHSRGPVITAVIAEEREP